MSAGLPRPSVDENISTTLSSGITDVATSMDVADASKIVAPCFLVIDQHDSAGALKTTSLWEYVKVTNVASNTLTISRGQGGSTQQAHGSGAVVEAVVTSTMFEEWYNALNPEHDSSGGHVITGTMTVAGMNLASVATIANASFKDISVATTATMYEVHVSKGLLAPSWYIPSLPSLPTVGLGRPASMPRGGTLNHVSITLNGIVSSPTVFFDINKDFNSIFDAGCRPLIANGTFVSTASIATKAFGAGAVFNVDYDICDLGGNSRDAIVTLVAQ